MSVRYVRWYADYRLPDHYDNQIITVRLHGNAEDEARRFNRTENVRPIPPGDPDFARLYPRRLDAESINRGIDESLWIGRAHSVGHARQHLNLLGCALMVNGLALHRYQHRAPDQLAARQFPRSIRIARTTAPRARLRGSHRANQPRETKGSQQRDDSS